MDDLSKISNCKICLLAQAMKDCKACQFNIGLVYKTLDLIKEEEIKAYPDDLRDKTFSNLKLSLS